MDVVIVPKITDIQEQKRNKNRVNIFIDGEFALGVDKYSAEKNGFKIGMSITKEKMEAVVFDSELEKAKGYLVDYLLHKSKKEIERRLKEKEYSPRVIEALMDFIERYNVVDDTELARKISNDALFIKDQGRNKIRQKLKQKGIKEEDIDKAFSNIEFDDEVEAAKKALSKKIDTYKRKAKNDYDYKNKCYAYLYQRGFTGDVIEKALRIVEE